MPGKFFLDTNIFVYSFDDTAREKQQKARELIKSALRFGNGYISFQVIQGSGTKNSVRIMISVLL